MASISLIDQLDQAIDVLIAAPDSTPPRVDPAVRELLSIASDLFHLPSPDFKARLKTELLGQEYLSPTALARVYPMIPRVAGKRKTASIEEGADILPTLSGTGYRGYPAQRSNFAASFLLHAAALGVIATSGYWMAQHRQEISHTVISLMTEPSPYTLPSAADESGGGGGGGDRDKLAASKGSPPKFAREQFTPPAVVLRNLDPKLAVEPTVVGPPDLKLAQMSNVGDPMSKVLGPPSNGTGSGGGIGSGTGGGVGSGNGPGLGPGHGGGIGGGAYRVGGGVSAPRVVYSPDPEYSDEARQAKYQGAVVLWCVVGPDGRVQETRVQRSLGLGLDEKAIEAVKTWKFEPARKDGQAVAVQINVEINFRLY